MSCTKSVTTESILAFSKLVPDVFEKLMDDLDYDDPDPPRIPPRTRNRHWDAAYELFGSDNTDAAVAGAFIMQLLAIQEAACDIQSVRRN